MDCSNLLDFDTVDYSAALPRKDTRNYDQTKISTHARMVVHLLNLAVYMDDILIISDEDEHNEAAKEELTNTFSIIDGGTLHYMLGIDSIYKDQTTASTTPKKVDKRDPRQIDHDGS